MSTIPYLRLGVNIDHVATIRNARGGTHPDPVRAAKLAVAAGADGITAHLREDRRHIRDEDIARLKTEISKPLNFEMAATDDWAVMVVKQTDPVYEQIAVAAPSGQYALDVNGALTYRHAALDWHQLRDESEAFFLRIYGPGDFRWQGADLGVLVTRGPVSQASGDQPGALTPRAQHLVESIRARYAGTPLALVS